LDNEADEAIRRTKMCLFFEPPWCSRG